MCMWKDLCGYIHCLNINSAEHRCECPGCGEVFVLDGNMKNNCEVCSATKAGYAEFSGLTGKVPTGCPNTPAYKSRYCSLHSPLTVTPKQIQFSDDGTPLTDSQIPLNEERQCEERHAAIIASKRVTRSSTFYQVSYQYEKALQLGCEPLWGGSQGLCS